jgi:hypothetical protein
MERKINPEVKEMFSYIPEVIYTQENLAAKRNEMNEMFAGIAGSLPVNDAVITSERCVPGADGDPDVRIKIYEPNVKFHLYPGCFHGFEEYFPTAEISQRIVKGYNDALKRAIHK